MTADSRLDDAIYKQVGEEVARRELHPGPMARAVAESKGNRDLVEGLYIRCRIEELRRQVDGLATCPACGHVGKPERAPRGSTELMLLLYFLGVVPGLLYGIAFSGYKGNCASCGKTVVGRLGS